MNSFHHGQWTLFIATCDMLHIEGATKEDTVLAYATLAEQRKVDCIAMGEGEARVAY